MKRFRQLHARPYELMCVLCAIGRAGPLPGRRGRRIAWVLRAIRKTPGVPVTLRCNVESVYRYQSPGRALDTPEGELFNDKRDLDILEKLGLTPGATRPARELLTRLIEKIPDNLGICHYAVERGDAWRGCPLAARGYYGKGRAKGISAILAPRAMAEKARFKRQSARAVHRAKVLKIRPHHLMCMACVHAGQERLDIIKEDNLIEAIEVIRANPDIPITLVRGCCMICPPCSSYDPKTNLCVNARGMGLRDQKKDLDLLQRLGMSYGETLPARDMFRRFFDAIESTRQICGHDDGLVTGWEWTICGGADGNPNYKKARDAGLGFLSR